MNVAGTNERENKPMIGSPSNLELLLHCHYSPEPHERFHAPAIIEGIAYLHRQCIIKPVTGKQNVYETTDKGKAFIEHLMTIPFPVQKWEIPQE